jgi:hypothetical protein
MNGVASLWGVSGAAKAEGLQGSAADVVEVVLSWGDASARSVLGVVEVKAGGALTVGEDADLLVPAAVLGCARAEIVRYAGERATAIVPPHASLRVDGWPRPELDVEIARGHVFEIAIGAFVVRMTRGQPGTRTAPAPLASLRSAGTAWILGSALFHAAAFATVAFFCPSLGATQEDTFDYDRLALMQRMLNAHATPETEATPAPSADAGTSGGDVNAGQSAPGSAGAAGRTDATRADGRWAARGSATPETATLAREHALAEAEAFGILPMLTGGDPNAPVAPWGRVQNGSDDANAVGRLYGKTLGDAIGAGGLDLSGVGESGSFGSPDGIGLDGFGGLGHTGRCIGGGPCSGIGVGHGVGMVSGNHVPTFKGPRYANPTVNGRLPPEVIQRIVRANDGRYRFCYQSGLKTNPALTGRVTVRFMIDRTGAVAIAADGGSDIPDASVRQCVVSAFTSLTFPAPDSGTVTVVYPITFSPE